MPKNRRQRRAEKNLKKRLGRSSKLLHRLRRELTRNTETLRRYNALAEDLDELEALELENLALKDTNASLNQALEPAKRAVLTLPKIADLQKEVAKLNYQLECRSREFDLVDLPSDLPGVLNAIQTLYGEHIYFSPDARKSANVASFQNPWISWQLLRSMALTLPELYQEGGLDVESEFQRRTGFELALTESQATRKTKKFNRERVLTPDGIALDISAHVKYGNRSPKLLRVHYAVVRGIVIVAHCGDHLPTAGSERRR